MFDLPEQSGGEIAVPRYWESDMLPKAMRHNSGHGGSHTFISAEFINALLQDREPEIDVYEALESAAYDPLSRHPMVGGFGASFYKNSHVFGACDGGEAWQSKESRLVAALRPPRPMSNPAGPSHYICHGDWFR